MAYHRGSYMQGMLQHYNSDHTITEVYGHQADNYVSSFVFHDCITDIIIL